jgi:hypothetical protein
LPSLVAPTAPRRLRSPSTTLDGQDTAGTRREASGELSRSEREEPCVEAHVAKLEPGPVEWLSDSQIVVKE